MVDRFRKQEGSVEYVSPLHKILKIGSSVLGACEMFSYVTG